MNFVMTTPSVSPVWQQATVGQADAKDLSIFVGARALIRPDKERLVLIQRQLDGPQDHWAERIAATIEEDYDQLLKDFGCR
jgi:hypothetical protein